MSIAAAAAAQQGHMHASAEKVLRMSSTVAAMTPTVDVTNVNPNAREAKYAVRGEIVAKAYEYAADIASGKGSNLPFDRVVYCNIGNPQQLGQKPVSFFRQVLALCDYPDVLDNPKVEELYPADAVARARRYLAAIPGGVGAYSQSKGVALLRQEVAAAIEKRDGHPCSPDDLFLTDGASPTCHYLMKTLLRNKSDGVLTPMPQYPLYSATLELYDGSLVPYYLAEEKGWGMDVNHLKECVDKARAEGTVVRAMVVINPGNPTGQVLDEADQRAVVQFCKQENLLLVADEVYQDNVYREGKKFTSFKKIVRDLGSEYADFPLISMHSVSKGFYGECGRRAGYMEVIGINDEVKDIFLKLASVSLCSNISGQICMALVMNPPKPGEPSYELYEREKNDVLGSLKRRAVRLTSALDSLDGVSCNPAEGALYAFPRLYLPDKFCAEAKKIGREPDMHYCMKMLDATGVVTVPGSGFGQVPGTHHFRTTFLPSEQDIETVITNITTFHNNLMKEYS